MSVGAKAYIRASVRLEDRGHSSFCWIWTKCVGSRGYGHMASKLGSTSAHRVSYMAFKGAIPSNLEVDHLCRVRLCCNPDHLEAVTTAENIARANRARAGILRPMCRSNRHMLTQDNLMQARLPERVCRICYNEKQRLARRVA